MLMEKTQPPSEARITRKISKRGSVFISQSYAGQDIEITIKHIAPKITATVIKEMEAL